MVTVGDEEVERIAAAVARRLGEKSGGGPAVADVIARYLESSDFLGLADTKSERGRAAHVVRVLGSRDASTLSLLDIDELRKRLADKSPATRNRVVVRLTAALRWAADRGLIPRYPLPRVRLEDERNVRRTYRSEEDVKRVVQALQSKGRHVIAAIVATAYDSGMRRGEVVRLQLDQVDHVDGVVYLHAAETKGKRDRAVPLSAWASALILSLERPPNCPWAFPSRRAIPYYARTVLRYYQEACAEAGVAAARGERNVFHHLRSGFADRQVELGTPVPHLMEIGGWKDYRTVQRYLRRPGAAVAMEARARLEASRRRGPKRAPLNTRDEKVIPDRQNSVRN